MANEFEQRDSGLVLPVEQPKEKQHFVQRDLIMSQLPRYLARLVDEDATIEAVYRESSACFGGLCGFRYSVAYVHHEELATEIYC